MSPINPVLPFFEAHCWLCEGRTNSLSGATGDAPFTYICCNCQDDATREAVRLNTNTQMIKFAREQPSWVATARRALGIHRPLRTPYDLSWEGCGFGTEHT